MEEEVDEEVDEAKKVFGETERGRTFLRSVLFFANLFPTILFRAIFII